MKVALFELESWEKEYFEKNLTQYETLYFDGPLQEQDFSKFSDVEAVVIFIYSQMTAEVIAKLPNLKLISTMSTGYDHIDVKYCQDHNIVVSNVPAYGEYTVAEHTFALLLALSRNIIESYKKLSQWNFSPVGLTGFDLHGKTLGVIGVGNIGKNVIHIANGFGMKVLGYKRTPDPELEKQLGFTCVDYDRLFAESDIITLHVPYMPATHHLLNKDAFSKMKDGVIILNTARGALIDTNALMEALESGKVCGAGLDVLEEEPLLREEKELLSGRFEKQQLLGVLENHMLLTHPHVVITPHNAFNSEEALGLIVESTKENLDGYAVKTPAHVVVLKS